DSSRWLNANGIPTWPSPHNRERLPRAVGADPRFLVYAMPAMMMRSNSANAVALVVRSTERPPFTAWDEAALERMIVRSGHGVVCSWRDWFTLMRRAHDGHNLDTRLDVPLPRMNAMSLASVIRELAATA